MNLLREAVGFPGWSISPSQAFTWILHVGVTSRNFNWSSERVPAINLKWYTRNMFLPRGTFTSTCYLLRVLQTKMHEMVKTTFASWALCNRSGIVPAWKEKLFLPASNRPPLLLSLEVAFTIWLGPCWGCFCCVVDRRHPTLFTWGLHKQRPCLLRYIRAGPLLF